MPIAEIIGLSGKLGLWTLGKPYIIPGREPIGLSSLLNNDNDQTNSDNDQTSEGSENVVDCNAESLNCDTECKTQQSSACDDDEHLE